MASFMYAEKRSQNIHNKDSKTTKREKLVIKKI